MKMHCYFLLNVKRGASQLYWGGGLQISSAGTGYRYSRVSINAKVTLLPTNCKTIACNGFIMLGWVQSATYQNLDRIGIWESVQLRR